MLQQTADLGLWGCCAAGIVQGLCGIGRVNQGSDIVNKTTSRQCSRLWRAYGSVHLVILVGCLKNCRRRYYVLCFIPFTGMWCFLVL